MKNEKKEWKPTVGGVEGAFGLVGPDFVMTYVPARGGETGLLNGVGMMAVLLGTLRLLKGDHREAFVGAKTFAEAKAIYDRLATEYRHEESEEGEVPEPAEPTGLVGWVPTVAGGFALVKDDFYVSFLPFRGSTAICARRDDHPDKSTMKVLKGDHRLAFQACSTFAEAVAVQQRLALEGHSVPESKMDIQ